MKKVTAVVFSVFYLLVAAGFNVSAHWCGKKMYLVSVNAPHEKKCPCGPNMRPGCCKDFHTYVKINDNQKITSQVAAPNNSFYSGIISFCILQVQKPFSLVNVFEITNYHSPPFANNLPTYLTNRIFRI